MELVHLFPFVRLHRRVDIFTFSCCCTVFFYLKWLSSECRLTNETEYRYTQGVLKEVGIQTEMQYKIFLLWKLKLTSYINILLVFTFQNVRKNERLWKMAKLSLSNCHHYSTWIFLLLSVRAQVLSALGVTRFKILTTYSRATVATLLHRTETPNINILNLQVLVWNIFNSCSTNTKEWRRSKELMLITHYNAKCARKLKTPSLVVALLSRLLWKSRERGKGSVSRGARRGYESGMMKALL